MSEPLVFAAPSVDWTCDPLAYGDGAACDCGCDDDDPDCSVAALPVAGNVFILAQHYGVAPLRVSAAILISTTVSIVTVSGVIAWVKTFMPAGVP